MTGSIETTKVAYRRRRR